MNMESSGVPAFTPKPPVVLASSGTNEGSSELGSIYEGAGQTIAYWQGQLHSALTDWLSVAQQIQDIMQDDIDRIQQDMKTYRWMVNEYNAMLNEQKNNPKETLYYDFNSQVVQRMSQLFGDLGILFPPANVKYTKVGDQYEINCNNFGKLVNDLQTGLTNAVTSGYLATQLGKVSSQISALKQKQTEDMFKVMFFYQNVRMNEKTISGVMKSLTQIFDNMIRNVAT